MVQNHSSKNFTRIQLHIKNGNYWVCIDHSKKMRIQFNDEPMQAENAELIDLKITNWCNLGCDFCYQSSDEQGQHADYEEIVDTLGKLMSYQAVVEFAIGGGEPTSHPGFARIINYIKARNGIANFTTKSKSWFKDKEIVEAASQCAGIAYSCDDFEDIVEFYNLHREAFHADKFDYQGVKFYVHLIPELLGNNDFREIMAKIDEFNLANSFDSPPIHCTLLGFKPIGRGTQQVEKLPELIDIIQGCSNTSIGIDTKLANDYQEFLDQNGISRKLYTTQEGEFSMYYDAVEKTFHKSSYQLEGGIHLDKSILGYSYRKEVENVFQEIKKL